MERVRGVRSISVFEENRTVAEKLHAKYVSWLNDFDLANNFLDPRRTLS